VAILYGLGGIGKTQLAIHFARLHQDDFSAIFWLNGKNQKVLIHSLAELLPKLPGINMIVNPKTEKEIEQAAREVLQWLAAPGNSKWLLIFDNIDKYSAAKKSGSDAYDIARFFPSTDHGSIIITTRVTRLGELGSPYPVETLQFDEAATLLINSTGLTVGNSDDHLFLYSGRQ
jgi:hypothetical protein